MTKWRAVNDQITACRQCARLIDHCQKIARQKRRAYREWDYWGGPVPNLGKAPAELLIVGLAPGAHGANRTGRMFTGDRSGHWLYRALYRAGFANQPHSTDRDDGLKLIHCAITAICHCAPPDNKPTAAEVANCRPWLWNTLDLYRPTVILCLGQLAWNSIERLCLERQWMDPNGRAKFTHGAHCELTGHRHLLGSYHPSQQNTFTGRLTESMLDAVFSRAREWLPIDA